MLLVKTVALLSLGELMCQECYVHFAVHVSVESLVQDFRASFVLALPLIVCTVFLLVLAV